MRATRKHLGELGVGLLRADSGFCERAFLTHLEDERINYVIAMKLTAPLQRALVQRGPVNPSHIGSLTTPSSPPPGSHWWALDEGIELCGMMYQAPSWSAPPGASSAFVNTSSGGPRPRARRSPSLLRMRPSGSGATPHW
ncbi:MAG: hypothetical protein EAZ30_01270 [Betaproteobacteria bacterium]|nr:MAG: hypothetical protein EAZ30_01270 [Betaproteobacteria bacterium]